METQITTQHERQIFTLKRYLPFLGELHPAKLVLVGYFSYMLLGWLLLCIPFTQAGGGVSALDNLFIAASALSTTGLVTVSISESYNLLGQILILLLIQLGGIGYMTFGSFVILSRKGNLSQIRENIGQTVFSLPESFRVDKFIKSVITFTILIELLGALLLYFIFRSAGEQNLIWTSVFHSISAFCTAGFSLYNNSFEDYASNFWLNIVISMLSYLGAIGFIVWVDFWRLFSGKKTKVTLTSKIIISVTLWLSLGGTILIFITEPSISQMPVHERLLTSFFQAMTSMTTVGFNTIPIGPVSKATILLIITIMVIGASPSGTGGGLKSTTFSVIIGIMRSAIRGEKKVQFWGKPVPIERVWTAVAGLGFYLTALLIGTYFLEMTESTPLDANLFEAASALGTVGLSTGITAGLSCLGKIMVILLMFCGRLGPLTFGIALFLPSTGEPSLDSDLAV